VTDRLDNGSQNGSTPNRKASARRRPQHGVLSLTYGSNRMLARVLRRPSRLKACPGAKDRVSARLQQPSKLYDKFKTRVKVTTLRNEIEQ